MKDEDRDDELDQIKRDDAEEEQEVDDDKHEHDDHCEHEHCECKHCECDDDCDCDDEDDEDEDDDDKHHKCKCGHDCKCGDECECDDCECDDECECHHKKDHHRRHRHHHEEDESEQQEVVDEHDDDECHHDEAGQYLQMAQRLQADFDNYRKRVAEQLDLQREEGKRSVIEVFLPCLDTFKEAKKSITDENVLSGVNMIENKIFDALARLGVEKIESVGQKFDHKLHEVIAVLHDESKEDGIVLDEYQAGYTMNGKVIRYSKVVVNKLD